MSTRKSAQAFKTISEVATSLDVPQHVLRFWESKFSHVKPMKRGGGRRYYRPDDVDLLRGIRTLLYHDGFTIKGVQKVFRDRGVRFVIDTGRPGGERPVLAKEVSGQKPLNYDEVETGPTPKHESAPGLNGGDQSLSANQQNRLRDVLTELLELKNLVEATRGAETLTRSSGKT